jgi:type I restriction enzyme, S subunit
MRVECFPDAPADWPRMTVGQIAEVNPRYKLDKNTEYPFVEMAAAAENFGGITRLDSRKAEASGLARFKVNDILFGKITPCAENGKVALVKDLPGDFGLGSTEFIVLSPRQGYDPRFVYALVCSNPVLGRAISRMEGSTGRLRVTEDTFTKWLTMAVPPRAEREGIAQALEAVDAAIERTRTAIEKASLLRRGLIQHLVMGEANHGRPSGSSPIGTIPADWACVRLGDLIAEGPTNGLYRPDSDYHRDGIPIVRIDSFDDGFLHGLSSLYRVRLSEIEAIRYRISEGDILINRVNSLSHIGKSAIVPVLTEATVFESNMMRLRLKPEMKPSFLILVLCSDVARRHWLARAKPAVNQASVNQGDVRSLWVPLPDIDQQQRIVDVVSGVDKYRESLDRLLSLQNVLKRGLMQDLLTGRVRVTKKNGSGEQPKMTSEAPA